MNRTIAASRGLAALAAVLAAVAITLALTTSPSQAVARGKPAPPALTTEIISADSGTIAAGADMTLEAVCPAGELATGGGYTLGGNGADLVANWSVPSGTGWRVHVVNLGATDQGPGSATVYAVCGRLQ